MPQTLLFSRRSFLKTALGAAAFLFYPDPLIAQSTLRFRGPRVQLMPGISRHDLVKDNKLLGRVYWLEAQSLSFFLTRARHPALFDALSFSSVQQEIAKTIPSFRLGFFAAAAFVEKDWRTIQGLAAENGTILTPSLAPDKSLVAIKDGKLSLFAQPSPQDLWAQRARQEPLSLFQQLPVLHRQRALPFAPSPALKRRFLIQRATPDGQTTVGLVDFSAPLTLAMAAQSLEQLSLPSAPLHHAVYLDMGAVAWGAVRETNGIQDFPGTKRPADTACYTNILAVGASAP